MPLIHDHALPNPLNRLRPHPQPTHHTNLLLPLRPNRHHLALDRLIPPLRQPAPLAGQPGRHQRRAREHEADGTAVDAQAREGLREGVHEFQVRDQRVVHVLPEEGVAFVDVERDAVGSEEGELEGGRD